jgi:hypothetical protein
MVIDEWFIIFTLFNLTDGFLLWGISYLAVKVSWQHRSVTRAAATKYNKITLYVYSYTDIYVIGLSSTVLCLQ